MASFKSKLTAALNNEEVAAMLASASTVEDVQSISEKVADAADKVTRSPQSDPKAYLAVIYALAACLLIITATLCGQIIFALSKFGANADVFAKLIEVPDLLVSLASAALGAMAGIIAPNALAKQTEDQ